MLSKVFGALVLCAFSTATLLGCGKSPEAARELEKKDVSGPGKKRDIDFGRALDQQGAPPAQDAPAQQ